MAKLRDVPELRDGVVLAGKYFDGMALLCERFGVSLHWNALRESSAWPAFERASAEFMQRVYDLDEDLVGPSGVPSQEHGTLVHGTLRGGTLHGGEVIDPAQTQVSVELLQGTEVIVPAALFGQPISASQVETAVSVAPDPGTVSDVRETQPDPPPQNSEPSAS